MKRVPSIRKNTIKIISMLLVVVLLCLSVQITDAAPSMEAKKKVTWDCVWFGTYPQTEVVSENDSAKIAALKKMNAIYETKYEKISAAQYQKIVKASYDGNDDAIVDGVKYRRMKKKDALYTVDGSTGFYRWTDSSSYHYYKHEPIKWRVLKVNGGQALLLSDVVLDDQQYNVMNTNITWGKSTIRSWLNNYGAKTNSYGDDYSIDGFLKTAFTSAEQKGIKTSYVEKLNDKIFLLSTSEVKNTSYGFASTEYDEARAVKSSTYAYSRGLERRSDGNYLGNCYWWLRSPGKYSTDAVIVGSTGAIWDGRMAQEVDIHTNSVRPALSLNLSSDVYSYAGTVCSDGTVNETALENNTSGDKQIFPYKKKKRLPLNQKITASSRTVVNKSKAFNLNAKTNGGGKLTYSSSNIGVADVSSSGKVTVYGCGQTTITIKAASKGRYYAASKKVTITVIPQGSTLKKVTSPGKKRLKITWKKISGITGYDLQVCSKKTFTKNTMERLFKQKETKTTLYYMKSKKKYYVRIRSYKKVGSKKYYSKWSPVKTVKVK